MTRYFFVLALLAAPHDSGRPAQGATMAPLKEIANREQLRPLAEVLEEASVEARGARLCDETLRSRQASRFDQLYGERIDRLKSAYLRWHGPDPDLFQVGGCRVYASSAERAIRVQSSLKAFDRVLQGIEARYRTRSQ